MPRIEYVPKRFSGAHRAIIDQANLIVRQYRAQGFDLTLRQLYYQFVSRDLIPNNMQSYKRLGSIINDARLAGEIDWNAIIDRTRNVRARPHWETPESIIGSAAQSYHRDMWARQSSHVEVWIEKDALIGVIGGVCDELDVPHFSCRGYTSQSEVWGAARRMESQLRRGKEIVVVHLGDHDPSGIDMTRDITDRLNLFVDGDGFNADNLTVHRIALNSDQIEQYNPPPNPAKLTDSRAEGYIARFGDESWELDALEPNVIVDLIRETVGVCIDQDLWKEDEERIATERETLTAISNRYSDVVAFLSQE
jgi:hypothetical protein